MARLSDLIPGMAEALAISEPSVRNTASVLRLAKLLTSGPRGPGAPHMTPVDATNLLLAIMYDGDRQAAGTVVPALRAAAVRVTRDASTRKGVRFDVVPPFAFLRDNDQYRDLGGALDALFAELAAVKSDVDPGFKVAFALHQPACRAAMTVMVDEGVWSIDYRWDAGEQLGRAWDACLSSTRHVGPPCLAAIARTLAGTGAISAANGVLAAGAV